MALDCRTKQQALQAMDQPNPSAPLANIPKHTNKHSGTSAPQVTYRSKGIAEAFGDFVAPALVNNNNSATFLPESYPTIVFLPNDVAQLLAKNKIGYRPRPDWLPLTAFALDESDTLILLENSSTCPFIAATSRQSRNLCDYISSQKVRTRWPWKLPPNEPHPYSLQIYGTSDWN